jgi:hypothetical protein
MRRSVVRVAFEWTTCAPSARLGLIVRRDDGERELAHDRKSHVANSTTG